MGSFDDIDEEMCEIDLTIDEIRAMVETLWEAERKLHAIRWGLCYEKIDRYTSQQSSTSDGPA